MTILGIGTSALLAFQRSLAVTGNNIGNSATEGYSRQRVELVPGDLNTFSIRRIADRFVDAQLRTAGADLGDAEVRSAYAGRVDRLVADSTTGLAPALSRFFDAANDLANDPTSAANRSLLFNESRALVERFGDLNGRLEEQRTRLNGEISQNVDEINQMAASLADINARVLDRSGGRTAPNDLLDQRDLLVNQLSKKVGVKTTIQDDGSMNVFIGSGQALVIGGTARQLTARPMSDDPINLDIGYVQSDGGAVKINRFITDGELGSLLKTRETVLDPAQNQIGLIAVNLGSLFNAGNRLGLDGNGEPGGDVFRVPEPVVRASSKNATTGLPAVSIENVKDMTPHDYRLRTDGAGFVLQRLPDEAVIPMTEDPDNPGQWLAAGLRIDTNDLASAGAGDAWLIQPTRIAADRIAMNPRLIDGSGFATAGAMNAQEHVDNAGKAKIVEVRALDASDPATLFEPATLRFEAGVPDARGQFAVETALGTQSFDLTTLDPDNTGIFKIQHNGWEITLRGQPADGDVFTVSRNEHHVGDNRNMLNLAGLAVENTIQGKATYAESYTGILADIGSRARQAEIALSASTTVFNEVTAQRESIAGVNLDEEAANLLRYQQAYQAAAQIIATSSTLFDSLLAAARS